MIGVLIRKFMKTIKVFEHTYLNIDEENFTQSHFKLLVKYNERFGNKYFNVGHNRIYFKNYVGVFQVGNLIIEILPKADKSEMNSEAVINKWHKALIYMLQICGYLKINSISRAELQLQNITLIDLYFKLFIDEIKTILNSGLTKRYRHTARNLSYLKGRIVFNKHLTDNLLHKEKFYTIHQVYDYNNVYNKIILKALLALKDINKNNSLYSEISDLLVTFDGIDNIIIYDKIFDSLVYNRNTQRYKNAITLARMILQNYSPDVQNGDNSVIGILFDMNNLFEKVVYKIIKNNEHKFSDKNLILRRQHSRKFWNGKAIRPDIFGEYKSENGKITQRFVIDTKWKMPYNSFPDDADLKQMFAYNIHFGSQQSVLVYPRVKDCSIIGLPFNESEAVKEGYNKHSCATFFIDLFTNEGRLNKNAGDKIISNLLSENCTEQRVN